MKQLGVIHYQENLNNNMTKNLDKRIEEVSQKIENELLTEYCRGNEDGLLVLEIDDFRKVLRNKLQSLLDEQKKEIVERIKEEIDLLGEPNDILHEDLNNILNKII